MRYICENDHRFEHTAKLITESGQREQLEVPVCPICTTRVYSEYEIKQRITSVMSVPLDAVDAILAEGYEVEALYAKTATLVRRE